MGFCCAICMEGLHKAPVENAPANGVPDGSEHVNICATPCGHIFHAFCINQWMK